MNLKYINVMVSKKNTKKDVDTILSGETGATARMIEERKHGYLIRVGAPTTEQLQRIADAATNL